jgi:PPM family protein phosphatase
VKFKETVSYTHIGRRSNQEDSFYFDNKMLVVSDGVGGEAKGEMASQTVVNSFKDYYSYRLLEGDTLRNLAAEATFYITLCLNNLKNENVHYEGMAATLATVYFVGQELACTHIGDSRIYHFSKEGKIKWRSKDHSLVQELVEAEVITAEEAVGHPQRNVITRVLQAKENAKARPEVFMLENLEIDDKLFLCTDGVLEAWSDLALEELLSNGLSNQELLQAIHNECVAVSKDNNTAILTSLT